MAHSLSRLRKSHLENLVNESKNPFTIGRTARDIETHLKNRGWELERQKGEHNIYAHPKSQNKIAVPRHKGDIPPGTIRNIMRNMNEVS